MRIFGEFQITASQHFTMSGGEVRSVIFFYAAADSAHAGEKSALGFDHMSSNL
jgi:hypothetical protein